MKVYRFENDDGDGPYGDEPWMEPLLVSDEDEPPELSRLPCDQYKLVSPWYRSHPTPQDDGIDVDRCQRLNWQFACGFSSIDQARAWFTPKQMKGLTRHGYGMKEYEVPKNRVAIGAHQVLFDTTHAASPREISIHEQLGA